jgi:hypothetical protein
MDGRAPPEGLLRSFTMSNNPRWCKPNPARERSPGFRRHRSARAAAATCRQRPAIITPWEVAAWSGRSNPQHQALGSLGPAPSVQPAAGARLIAGLVFYDPWERPSRRLGGGPPPRLADRDHRGPRGGASRRRVAPHAKIGRPPPRDPPFPSHARRAPLPCRPPEAAVGVAKIRHSIALIVHLR